MSQSKVFAKLEKGFRFLSMLQLALILFQGTGVLTYLLTVWPGMRDAPSTGITALAVGAVAAGLARSCLWIRIYWDGAKVASTLRAHGESTELSDRLGPILGALTRLLVASCALDVLLLPSIFLMDAFFPFSLSSVHLGLIQLASMLLPQAFGVTALILAYLAHGYGQIMKERCRMKTDLELTI